MSGSVTLLDDDSRERELVFSFPVDEELNEAVRQLPGRWFDWRRKNWRVPAEPRAAKGVEAVLARFPELEPSPQVLEWLRDAGRWRALVTVLKHEGSGAFVMRTLSGDVPSGIDGALAVAEDRLVFPFDRESAEQLSRLQGVELDDLARACVADLRAGRDPAPAELTLEVGEEAEPELALLTRWDHGPAFEFRRLPEAHPVYREGRFFNREAAWGVAVPADPALAERLSDFLAKQPSIDVEPDARALTDELMAEHVRASEVVALSYAEDAPLDDLRLGGELHPFQRAGVRYALDRRRTFIADEQGLGKTVQALATLEADGAFPAVVVCPASMKLMWARESGIWLPDRTVAVLSGRADEAWTEEVESAEIVVLNYDILEAHLAKLVERGPRALVLDESHYVKNPQAGRTKAALELADALLELFFDEKEGGLFTVGHDAEQLLVRQKDYYDGATPSANGVGSVALLRLGALTGETRYSEAGQRILRWLAPSMASAPQAFTYSLAGADLVTSGIDEVAVVGDRPDLAQAVQARYLPRAVLAWGEPYPSPLWEGRRPGLAYVCRDFACQAPVERVDDLVAQLGG